MLIEMFFTQKVPLTNIVSLFDIDILFFILYNINIITVIIIIFEGGHDYEVYL